MTDPSPYELRWSRKTSLMVWLAWLAGVVVWFAPWLKQQLERVVEHFPSTYAAVLGLMVLATLPLPLLHRGVSKRGWWRYEPALVLAACFAICLFYEPRGTAVIVWIFVAAYAAGRFGRRRLGLEGGSAAGEIVCSSALGLGLLIVLLIGLGLAGGYRPGVFAVLLAVPVILFRRDALGLWKQLREIQHGWSQEGETGSWLLSLGLVFGGAAVLCALMVMLTPSIQADPLQFHLPLAQHYAAAGALTPMPSDIYCYNPQSVELLMALAYSLGGQAAAQMVHPMFFLLLLVALYTIGREFGISRSGCLLGCVFAATIPLVHWTGVNMKNDVAAGFFQLSGLLAFLRWRKGGNFRWIHAGVFFAATAWSVKHPAAFGVIGVAALFIYAAWKQPRRLRAFVSCAVIFAVFGSFWMVRAYVEMGDAFFPNNAIEPFARRSAVGGYSLQARLLRVVEIPWLVHRSARGGFQTLVDRAPGIFLIVTLPLWGLVRWRREFLEARAGAVFIGVSLLAWALHEPFQRFVVAPAALLFLLGAARLEAWYNEGGRAVRASLYSAAALSLCFALSVMLVNEINAGQVALLAGRTDRAGYLRGTIGTYASVEALGRYATVGDNVLSVGNLTRAYAPDPSRFYYIKMYPLKGPDYWRRVFGERDYRYLILPTNGRFDFIIGLTPGVELLHRDGGFRVYRLRGGRD